MDRKEYSTSSWSSTRKNRRATSNTRNNQGYRREYYSNSYNISHVENNNNNNNNNNNYNEREINGYSYNNTQQQIQYGGDNENIITPPPLYNDNITTPSMYKGNNRDIPPSREEYENFNRPISREELSLLNDTNITAVFAAFTKADGQRCRTVTGSSINYAVSSTGQFIHCELVFKGSGKFFPPGKDYLAFTVYQGGNVMREYKDYSSNEKWHVAKVTLNDVQSKKAFIFCQRCIGKPFSMLRIVPNFMPYPFRWLANSILNPFKGEKGETYFCSELILDALRFSTHPAFSKDIYRAENTTPSVLYEILRSNNAISIGTLEDIVIKLNL